MQTHATHRLLYIDNLRWVMIMLVLSMHDDPALVHQALAGADPAVVSHPSSLLGARRWRGLDFSP